MNVIHKYQVKCIVILDTIGLRNIRRGGGKAPCILNVSVSSTFFPESEPRVPFGQGTG